MMKKRAAFGLFLVLLMMIVAACSSDAAGSNNTNLVKINLSEFKINAPQTTFISGQSYHFVVINTGQTAHEFMIMPQSEGSMSGMSMDHMDKMALITTGDINPGETKTLDYTFPSSLAGSHPELACYLPGHYDAGMKQSVTIS